MDGCRFIDDDVDDDDDEICSLSFVRLVLGVVCIATTIMDGSMDAMTHTHTKLV